MNNEYGPINLFKVIKSLRLLNNDMHPVQSIYYLVGTNNCLIFSTIRHTSRLSIIMKTIGGDVFWSLWVRTNFGPNFNAGLFIWLYKSNFPALVFVQLTIFQKLFLITTIIRTFWLMLIKNCLANQKIHGRRIF